MLCKEKTGNWIEERREERIARRTKKVERPETGTRREV
jgi:hypothetical protein